ncbi:hypothetical protein [Paucibacter soli]|uniref:hypothetical protein n=1 Tax=Paucibacter soli TaxID=3133433 RepID=UPI0030A8FB0D
MVTIPNKALLLGLTLAPLMAGAQESVNAQLDACIREQQRAASVKGAALGALGKLGSALLSRRQEPREERHSEGRQLTLSIGGGAGMGLASAWFKAAGACYEQHPDWIPASQLQRGADYARAIAETGYRPEMGPLLQLRALDMPGRVRAGENLEIRSAFVLLTPLGDEAEVLIERRLFAIADGKEQALPFTGHARESRVLAPGESLDLARLPIPKEVPVGVAYRYEFSVAAAGLPARTLSATVQVE